MLHKNIRVTGRVQGVGFRYSARQVAREIGVKGFVRNQPDGSVYIEAEGEPDQVERFLAWCREGPSRAVISHVSVYDSDVRGFTEFLIS